jgi:peroxiredoxin
VATNRVRRRILFSMLENASPPNVGDAAPDFTLVDSHGAMQHLAELCAEHPLVLVFYRGHW